MVNLLRVSALMTAAGCLTLQAALVKQIWNSQEVYTYGNIESWNPNPPEADGEGWQVDIALAGSPGFNPSLVEHAGTTAMWGWYDGYGYAIGPFQFDAVEGQEVVMRIYNGTKGVDATRWVDSQPLVLPDLGAIPAPGDTDVTFVFVPGTTWGWRMDVQSPYGTPVNYSTGNDNWICLVNSPSADGGTNYVCTGWVGTGDAPASGTKTNTGPFTIYQDSSLTWQWAVSEFWLETGVTGEGAVDISDGWYTDGTNLYVTAVPANGWFFTGWAGDLSGDASSSSTNMTMDAAKTIIAKFGRDGDYDGDYMDDDWEIEHFGSIDFCDPDGDPDGDLYTNLEEFENETDPNVWDIYLERQPAIELTWKLVPGYSYQVQFKNKISATNWTNLGELIVGDGTTNSVLDSARGSDKRYYRVITVP